MSENSQKDYGFRHQSFEHWFQTPLGRSLLADQRRCIDRMVSPLTGARQLQVGLSHRLPLAGSSDFAQKILTTPEYCRHLPEGVAVCDSDELPLPGDSIDLVLLHHTQDFARHPHQVLREAARVLRGGGSLVLIGFNPLSLWGLRRLISRSRSGPWGGRFLLPGRMEDWLTLLDFEVEERWSRFYRPPFQRFARHGTTGQSATQGASRFLPLGAYYSILATKRIGAPIRKRPVWRQQAIQFPGTVGASRGAVNKTQNRLSESGES